MSSVSLRVPGLGFEPRQREPKSLVLPLHYPGEPIEGFEPPTGCLQNNYSTTELYRQSTYHTHDATGCQRPCEYAYAWGDCRTPYACVPDAPDAFPKA